ncbi:ABC transporter permease [Nesterenkonia alkaliphila]|uniref:Transport permease protein n=1 Tax=Nesterenkonia alkaliphila TaxID=1463631 RepID=A0A7K1UHA5_9MICC|nr:ABC transporter permease [Nesterenkonia alkaliphila]MVT25848.1 ABC transporter permease [Nesterenkonia alkaliphila]GFZ76648.1 transport permease protein [Nesterenkonia alkaliphila]
MSQNTDTPPLSQEHRDLPTSGAKAGAAGSGAAAEQVSAAGISAVLLPTDQRPTPSGALSGSVTFGWRAMLKIKHIPMQLFDVTIFPIMMTVMFTLIFGGAMGAVVSGSGETGGAAITEYVQFFIPGIFVQTLIMITMYTGLTLNKDISKGIFDRFRSLPTWRPAQLVGALLGDQVRYTLAGTIILTVGFIVGFRPDGGVSGVLAGFALLLVFSFCLSWVWTMVSLLMPTEEAVMGVSMTLIFPLTFASNIFVPTATMPGWLQPVVDANPVSVLVTAVRELMDGTYDAASIGLVALYCLVLVAVFAPISMYLYNRKS